MGRILAEGSGNFVGIIKNLQVFVTALRDSNEQIVSFNDRLATLSSVLDGSKSDLDAALTNLSVAIAEVKRFVAGTRNQTAEQLQGLTQVTQTLVDVKMDLEQVLHVAPNVVRQRATTSTIRTPARPAADSRSPTWPAPCSSCAA